MTTLNDSLPKAPTLSDLQLPPWILARLTQYFNEKTSLQGICLVTGTNESFVTAGLYALLTEFAKQPLVSFSIERAPHYAPVQMHRESSCTQKIAQEDAEYLAAIRAALLYDPDLILTDKSDTTPLVDLLMHSSLTGHAMLVGHNAPNTALALTGLTGLATEPQFVGNTVEIVLAVEPLSENNSVAAYELIMMTKEMRDLLQTKPDARALWALAENQGSRSMLDDAKEKAAQGLSTAEELAAFQTRLAKTALS